MFRTRRALPSACALLAAVWLLAVMQGDSSALGGPPTRLTIESTAFRNGGAIPKSHTGDGSNTSPPLKWSLLPSGTKELALICEDPDAPRGTWVHWVIYGIPATVFDLKEGIAKAEKPANPRDVLQGKNSWGTVGYRGPNPPKGSGVHHYHFKLYALDAPLKLKGGLDKPALLAAMKDHILAETEIVGTCERR